MLLLLWLLRWSDYLWNLLRPRIPKQYLRPRALRRGLFLRKLLKLREKWNHVGRPRKQVKMELEQYEWRADGSDGSLVPREYSLQKNGYHSFWNHAHTIRSLPCHENVSLAPPSLIHRFHRWPLGKRRRLDDSNVLSSRCRRLVVGSNFTVLKAFRISRNWRSKSKNESYTKTWFRVCH